MNRPETAQPEGQEEVAQILRQIQWCVPTSTGFGSKEACPVCDGYKPIHHEGCKLAAALARAAAPAPRAEGVAAQIKRLAGPKHHLCWTQDGRDPADRELVSLVREADLQALIAAAAPHPPVPATAPAVAPDLGPGLKEALRIVEAMPRDVWDGTYSDTCEGRSFQNYRKTTFADLVDKLRSRLSQANGGGAACASPPADVEAVRMAAHRAGRAAGVRWAVEQAALWARRSPVPFGLRSTLHQEAERLLAPARPEAE